jgi:uncharacterized protein with PIN domain
MNYYTLQKIIDTEYLVCSECKKQLIQISEVYEVEGYKVNKFSHFECPCCGDCYRSYSYKVDDEGNIKEFKLKK